MFRMAEAVFVILSQSLSLVLHFVDYVSVPLH